MVRGLKKFGNHALHNEDCQQFFQSSLKRLPWWCSNLFVDLQIHECQENDWNDSQDKEVAPITVQSDVIRVLHLRGVREKAKKQWWPDFCDCGPKLEIILNLGPHFSKFCQYLVAISSRQNKNFSPVFHFLSVFSIWWKKERKLWTRPGQRPSRGPHMARQIP